MKNLAIYFALQRGYSYGFGKVSTSHKLKKASLSTPFLVLDVSTESAMVSTGKPMGLEKFTQSHLWLPPGRRKDSAQYTSHATPSSDDSMSSDE